MIAQAFRFHGHGSLRYLYRNGEAVRTRMLTVRHIHNPRRKKPRFAVIVAKKVFKQAVKRNRMRRRIYEIIRELQPHMKGGHDIAITVFSPDLYDTSFTELREQIADIFIRAELLIEESATNSR